jgi:hypothetical protein
LREGSLQHGHGVSVALETGLLLPDSERRSGAHVASIFSWRWPALTLHLNLGNDLLTSIDYAASTSLIVEGPIWWPVRPVTEVFVEREFGAAKLARGLTESLLVGAIATWTESRSLDLALRAGRIDGARVEEIRAGFTWTFDLLSGTFSGCDGGGRGRSGAAR